LIGGFELLRELSTYQTVGYALILLVVTRFLPGGLLSLGPLILGFFSQWFGQKNKVAAQERPKPH
jgi:hypothetical protein